MSNRSIALPSGTMIESFEIRRVIGTGGFGVTYLGFDRDLERAVAIKEYCPQGIAERDDDESTLVPATADDEEMFSYGLGRFLDEARTLAKFQHPSIVHVHRFLEGNGTGYLIMDYEEGHSLWQVLLRQKTLSESELVAMLLPILEGLQVIHAQKYLHRDIKPGNIMLRETGPPVLLDFGAARQAMEQQGAALTVMLTPGYAPIEQYSSTDQQGPWSDLYAVGATCFHCMTGEAPVAATDRLATFHGLSGDPVNRRVDELGPQYSPVLLDAIKWMLEAAPANRPQSTREVLRQLRTLRPSSATATTMTKGSNSPTEVQERPADFKKTPELSLALQKALEKSGVTVARKVVGPALATATSYNEVVDFLAGFILDDTRQSIFVEHARNLPASLTSRMLAQEPDSERPSGAASGRKSSQRASGVASERASAQRPSGPASERASSQRPSSDGAGRVPARRASDRASEYGSQRGPEASDAAQRRTHGEVASAPASGPPSTQSLRDEVIAHAERHLAAMVGPIASVLVEQAASVANTRDEFYELLAEELDSREERETFLKSLR